MQISALGRIAALQDRPTPTRHSPSEMRIFLFGIVLGAAAVVDNLWLDGRYSHALWQQANYDGQQFRDQVALIVGKVVGR